MEQPSLTGWTVGRWASAGAAGLLLAAGAWVAYRAPAAAHKAPAPSAAEPVFAGNAHVHIPSGVRVTVEVLNGTRVHGLARRATLFLRDHGFDVVLMGTVPDQHDTTLILDRTHHAEWADLTAQALGNSRSVEAADSSSDVDLTVVLGATWRPPADPFYP